MQLTPPEYDSGEGGMRPLEEVVLCRRLPDDDYKHEEITGVGRVSCPLSSLISSSSEVTMTTTTSTTTTCSVTTTSSQSVRPTTITTSATTCQCSYTNDNRSLSLCPSTSPVQTVLNKKRKLEETEDNIEENPKGMLMSKYNNALEKYRRFLPLSLTQQVPLFYLYGDLLLIPKYKWGSGVDVGGGRRRTSLGKPDLNTPLDSSAVLEASSQPHPRADNPSLVQVCPDSQTLEEGGFSPEWFSDVMQPIMNDLNKYGVCVVDNFLGEERAEQILGEVMALYSRGVFHDGQVVSRTVQDQARGIIRGDKITWVTGSEPHCGNIGQLVSVVDTLIAKANHHHEAGELAQYNITWRTRAMVACYPGRGSHYVKHVDNPDGDGRCITAIYYINKNWQPEDGGVLRIYPEGTNQVADVDPKFDRMLFFWSDRRNPHEVLPATVTSRYAITVWYLDQSERERYIARVSGGMANT